MFANVCALFPNVCDINWWRSPAESSDLNSIELVWGSMKTFFRDKHKPRTLLALKDRRNCLVLEEDDETCAKYIDHLQKVMPIVVQEEGC